MKFQDYYATMGIEPEASADELKRTYRKLARKYHPDVSKEPDAEARFKDVAEAYEVLKDPEKRTAYDQVRTRWQQGGRADVPPDAGAGFEWSGPGAGAGGFSDEGDFADHSDFFEHIFGRSRRGGGRQQPDFQSRGQDHHAKILIALEDAYNGATRTVTLRMPAMDASGQMALQEHSVEVKIPKGIRAGQNLRLAGQGGPGIGGGEAGDLYLEVAFKPHKRFRVQDRDVSVDLPVAPWEAALGAQVKVRTPEATFELRVPPNSADGTRLRLKGKGLPGNPPGDFNVILTIALPPADSPESQGAWRAMAGAFPGFDPRAGTQA